MSLLDAHLDQISLCAVSIADLPFPKPKIFTNALLQPHDITTLIRDTEPHERALFSVPPPPSAPKAQDPSAPQGAAPSRNRRNTTFNIDGRGSVAIDGGGANAVRAPRRNTAVAAVLGRDLVDRIRKGGGGGAGSGLGYREGTKGDINVEVLLEGAEKLCGVYPMPGALEKIASYRQRYRRLATSIEDYEIRVEEQAEQLRRMDQSRDYGTEDEVAQREDQAEDNLPMTEEDLRREEEEIKELERKKKGLEDRVTSMGRDISGVLR